VATALDRILAYKAEEVAAAKRATPLRQLDSLLAEVSAPRGFAAAMDRAVKNGANALICELKRKSPSAGDILPGADPVQISRAYEAGGAACLSILTDGPSFGGSLADLTAIGEAVTLPLLRKDFMVDPYQIVEARAHGADAILVIMAALDDGEALEMTMLAQDLGMDAVIEVHDAAELDRALTQDLPGVIGINNRNLKTMTTDLGVSEHLAPLLPGDRAWIAESGIRTTGDIRRLQMSGARRFLIGESLMGAPDRTAAARELRNA